MKEQKFLVRLSVMSLLLSVSLELHAQTCSAEWTGNAGNGAWSTAGNWSPRKVPGAASNVCIPTLTTADATATPSISVHSIQIGEGGSLYFGSGKVSIATSLINQGFVTLYGTTLSAASINLLSGGEVDVYDTSSIFGSNKISCDYAESIAISWLCEGEKLFVFYSFKVGAFEFS